jgi:fermentation-respiration switch protein FrsA (DUF1100 family)
MIGAIFLFSLLAVAGLSIYVGLQLTKPEREPVSKKPSDYDLVYEDISFKSIHDGIELKGWWIPAQADQGKITSDETVIFSHGYGNNRLMSNISATEIAKTLVNSGYNVVMFDFRGSGESEGETVTIGDYESKDLLSAIQYVKDERGSNDITLFGWSMGAVSAILAGVQSESVTKIIADSPFANLKEYLQVNLPHWSNLPSYPFTPVILATIPMLAGVDIESVSPYEEIEKLGSHQSILIIHSKDDEAIPYENSVKIYEAAPDEAEVDLWLTEGADHVRTYLVDKKAYEEKILSFLKKTR